MMKAGRCLIPFIILSVTFALDCSGPANADSSPPKANTARPVEDHDVAEAASVAKKSTHKKKKHAEKKGSSIERVLERGNAIEASGAWPRQ
jgi:hypothetical protein